MVHHPGVQGSIGLPQVRVVPEIGNGTVKLEENLTPGFVYQFTFPDKKMMCVLRSLGNFMIFPGSRDFPRYYS